MECPTKSESLRLNFLAKTKFSICGIEKGQRKLQEQEPQGRAIQ